MDPQPEEQPSSYLTAVTRPADISKNDISLWPARSEGHTNVSITNRLLEESFTEKRNSSSFF